MKNCETLFRSKLNIQLLDTKYICRRCNAKKKSRKNTAGAIKKNGLSIYTANAAKLEKEKDREFKANR